MVRVISRPDGPAPEWVRDGWIGLELPLSEFHRNEGPEDVAVGLFVEGGRAMVATVPGYHVNSREALEVLAKSRPDLRVWWEKNIDRIGMRGSIWYFSAESCQLVG